jgi:hypothetical protein
MSEHGSFFVAETTLATIKTLINQSGCMSAKDLMTFLKRE